MKKIIYIATAACLVLSSCNLERLPHSGYTPEQMDTNPTAVTDMLTGIYGQMKTMAEQVIIVGEFPGDNAAKNQSTTDDMADYMTYNHRVRNNSRIRTIWNNSYKVIAQSSEIIGSVDQTGASGEELHMLGEAYYLRGMSYFFLTRVFGRPYYQNPETNLAVPIINGTPEDILDVNLKLPDRSTVAVLYNDQIIPDLKKAEELMIASKVTKSNIFASAQAAQAMLSRVYLYMSGTYANPNVSYADLSIEYADKVISSGRFSMLSRDDFKKYNITFPEDNKETIFAIKRTSTDITDQFNALGGFFAGAGGSGWNEMYASEKYLDRLRHSGRDPRNLFGVNATDVRGAFIHPYYAGQSQADTDAGLIPATGEDVFRVVVDVYDDATGKLSNFAYKQLAVSGSAGSYKAKEGDAEYPLIEVDGRYTFEYTPKDGPKTIYVGDIDKKMNTSGALSLPMMSIFKLSLEGGVQNTHSPVISRLAEMYLNLAECYVKKGVYDKALENVNVIRNRAVVGNPITMDQITAHGPQVVDNERALEFLLEAHRGFDAFRVGFSLEHRYPAWMSATDGINHNLITIPADHERVIQILENQTLNAYSVYGGLTQNPVGTMPAPTYEPFTTFIPY